MEAKHQSEFTTINVLLLNGELSHLEYLHVKMTMKCSQTFFMNVNQVR